MYPIRFAPEFGINFCVNTHTPEHFLYRIHGNDPAWKVIRYRVNQASVSQVRANAASTHSPIFKFLSLRPRPWHVLDKRETWSVSIGS